MSALSPLIARLEKAEGPSQELDRLIASVVLGRSIGVSKWTASIDAAVSLAERVMPGARWDLTTTGFKPGASLVTDGGIFGGYADTPALAICLATLRALQQKGSSND